MINGIIIGLSLFILFLIYLTLTDQKVHYSDQNLTDGKGPMWRQGRAWWYITPRDDNKWRHGPGARLEWSVGRDAYFMIDLTVLDDEGGDIQIGLGLPWLFRIWLTLERLPLFDRIPYKWRRNFGYETSLKIHGGSIWIHVLHSEMWGSSSVWRRSPRWIHIWRSTGYKEYRGVGFHISLSIDDLILGQRERTETTIGDPIVREIPIEPDNSLGLRYYGTFQQQEEVRWRSRLPWRKTRRVYWEIEVRDPPLHAGKGENSYDQGDDGIIGTSAFVETIEEAIADYQQRVQRDRKKYGMPNVIYERQREIRR